MRILSDHRIEYAYEKNAAAYKFFSFASPFFRICTIAFVFPSVFVTPYFVFGVAGSLFVSLLCDIIAKEFAFTIRIVCCDNVFSVEKITVDGNKKEIFSCRCGEIDSLSFACEEPCVGTTDDFSSRKRIDGCETLEIVSKNRKIYVTADAYTYALVDERRKNDDISR